MADSTYQRKIYHKQGGDELVVANGGKITLEAGAQLNDPNGANLLDFVLGVDIADLSAEADYYLVVPWKSTLTKLWSVIDGVVGTADATITPLKVGGSAMTGGAITITQSGSAAADVDSSTPSDNNTFNAGDVLKLTVSGGGSGGSPRGHVAAVFQRT